MSEIRTHSTLNRVFERMQYELTTSIDIVANRQYGAHSAGKSNVIGYP